ncbi:tRNA lysidine(34) synthetase TilS [Kistimonas asteriae]|uniref:tRNA lysidine(34) synthetase TilS n=1 Tax=Kistimonas asteriae TaxID=517724 RepID=UPI001BA59FDD|nr:tRNA lysidine(34) synthetase TilS [Kistimonas asteriae]
MHLTDDTFLMKLPEIYRDRRLVVGLSGGLDSTVLLHLCVALRERGIIRSLEAIHVNHGLSANASDWQAFCETLCQRWSLPMVSRQVVVRRKTGDGLEASARAARYQQYEQILEPGDCLLQAHHLNDQAETLLYRMVRGCGVHGLAAIPRERALGAAMILRPLLDVSRETIHAYALKHQLAWVEDESNQDITYDRNFLRHEVVPRLNRRWSGALNNIGRLAEDAADVAALLDQVAEADLQQVLSVKDIPYHPGVPVLDRASLESLSDYRQRNVLRYWLRSQGFPLPGRAVVQCILGELVSAAQDACPVVRWEGGEIRRHEGAIVAMQPLGTLPSFSCQLTLSAGCDLELPGNGRIYVGYGKQEISLPLVRSDVSGLSLGYRSDIVVAPFRLPGRTGRKSLKKWFNELGVPSWMRDRLPVLHRGGELVAIPGLLVNAEYAASENEPGIAYHWQSPCGRQW